MRGGCAFVFALSIAIPSVAQTTAKEAQDLAQYPLTMDHVNRHYQTLIDLAQLERRDSIFKHDLQGWPQMPLDQQIQLYESNPKTAAIIKAHKITARDQVMTQTALMALMLALPSIEQGKGPNEHNKLQFDASPAEHVKFYRDHQAEITKLGNQLVDAALGKK